MSTYELLVNGTNHVIEAEEDTPLLWVLRDSLQLTGTKYGCGIGICGACTVQLNGAAVRSCVIPIKACQSMAIKTIEGLSDFPGYVVLETWKEINVPQCGYCQSGQILAAVDLLQRFPSPTLEQINSNMSGVLCRCGTYPRIRKAIQRAARLIEERK